MNRVKKGILLALIGSLLTGCASGAPKELSNEYVTVRDYWGVEIEKEEVKEVSERNVNTVIDHLMDGYIAQYDLPEDTQITDEIVVEAQMSETATTVEELREELAKMIRKAKEETAKEEEQLNLWEIVMDNSEVHEYPEERIEAIKKELYDMYEGYALQEGKTCEEYMEILGLTDEDILEAAQASLKQELVANLIAEEFGLKPAADELEKRTQEYVEDYGFTTKELLYTAVPEEEMYEMILRDIVKEWLHERCVYVEAEETDEAAEETAEETDTAKETDSAE